MAKDIQEPDDEGLVGRVNSVHDAQPPWAVSPLEPKVCALEFTTFRKGSLILMLGDKLISSRHKEFASSTVYLSSGGVSSHSAVAVVVCVPMLARRSCLTDNNRTAETSKICFPFPGRTSRTNPPGLIQGSNRSSPSSDKLVCHDRINIKLFNINRRLNVLIGSMKW